MPLGADQGIGALVWSTLGWGRLTGKIGRDRPIPRAAASTTPNSSRHRSKPNTSIA